MFPILSLTALAIVKDKLCSYGCFLEENIWAFLKWISEPKALFTLNMKAPGFVRVKLSHLRKGLYLSYQDSFEKTGGTLNF